MGAQLCGTEGREEDGQGPETEASHAGLSLSVQTTTHFVCSQSDLCWNFPKSERKFALKHHCGSLRVRVWSRDLTHHPAEIRISVCDRVDTTEARAPVKDLAPTLFQKFAACVQPHGKLKQRQGPSALHEREAKPQNGLYT